jgi:hypothetical protein
VLVCPVALGVVKPGLADGPIEGRGPTEGTAVAAPAEGAALPPGSAACANAIEPASSTEASTKVAK